MVVVLRYAMVFENRSGGDREEYAGISTYVVLFFPLLFVIISRSLRYVITGVYGIEERRFMG